MSTVALLAHGAGSTPATVVALLGSASPGARVVGVDARGALPDVVAAFDRAVASAHRAGDEVVLVGGLSLGAHAAASWASASGSDVALLLAMPAWTGSAGATAALTAASADEIERDGIASVIARLRADPAFAEDWVVDALARDWSSYDRPTLVAALRAAASSSAPTLDELARIRGPVAVLALRDDPLHPLDGGAVVGGSASLAASWRWWIATRPGGTPPRSGTPPASHWDGPEVDAE